MYLKVIAAFSFWNRLVVGEVRESWEKIDSSG